MASRERIILDSMATSDDQKPNNPKSTGFIPGDDAGTRWRNWYAVLTGKMNEKGREQYVEARDTRNEEADCKRCEKQRDYLLQFSKYVQTPVMT